MKNIVLILLILALLTGCYTTFYPNVAQQVEGIEEVPDSARQIIINNYYESNEYYQIPRYQRYSLLWGSYYWDPFYYDYGYYHWEPYYWYGRYYYYNPRSHYWYYYHHPYYHYGGGSGGNGGSRDRDRILKPGYEPLMSAPATDIAPFISVGTDNNIISRPGKRSDVDVNSGIGSSTPSSSSPRIESVGKSSDNTGSEATKSNDNSIYKPSGSNGQNSKSSSTTVSTPKSSRQSQPAIQKPASTTSSSGKKSSSESSTSNEKK